MVPEPLAVARRLGADRTVDVAAEAGIPAGWALRQGHFDVLFECSGNEGAIRTALAALRPRAVVVQLGLAGGEIAVRST